MNEYCNEKKVISVSREIPVYLPQDLVKFIEDELKVNLREWTQGALLKFLYEFKKEYESTKKDLNESSGDKL